MTGTVYVANFSWYFTPMWELAKRTLPPKALRIVMFPSAGELKEFVPEEALPKGIS
jgi:CRAL/TRIO domain